MKFFIILFEIINHAEYYKKQSENNIIGIYFFKKNLRILDFRQGKTCFNQMIYVDYMKFPKLTFLFSKAEIKNVSC